MNDKLIIEGNRQVTITMLMQSFVYAGLLEGLPNERMNQGIIAGLKNEAKKFCHQDEIYMIDPITEVIPYEGAYRAGAPIALPPICCIALLQHYGPIRDMSNDGAALGLIWFQREYAFPIDAGILETIKTIPFSKLCKEFGY